MEARVMLNNALLNNDLLGNVLSFFGFGNGDLPANEDFYNKRSFERKLEEVEFFTGMTTPVSKAEILCGEGDNEYKAILTATGLDVFKRASENPDVAGKKGEAFVKAALQLGGISLVERYKNGQLNDGENGGRSNTHTICNGTSMISHSRKISPSSANCAN